jgi:hypothetical protein
MDKKMQNTMRSLFSQLGFEFDKMQVNQPIDVRHLGYEVKTLNAKTGKEEWNLVLNIVRKQQAEHMVVSSNGRSLSCSPDHKIFVKSKESDTAKYKEVGLLKNIFTSYVVLTDSGWREFVIESKDELTDIADIEVEGEHSYLSNGILSHNTMYGDPSTTPGGMAIPYHASTRIKLTGGQQIKQSINGKEAVIGINVTCKTIKNKVARPWREVSFEIHFGKGVREDENLFDELRDFCAKCKDPVVFEGKRIIVEGASQWKYFQVIDNKTGAFVVDEKFYKSEFGSRVLRNPEYEDYINTLMDAAFIMVNGDDSHKTVASIDLGNASEVEAVKVEKLGKTGKSLLLD